MADRGFYLMHRGWLDHPVFDGDRFDRRSAWCWLIEEAAWAPRRRSIQGRTIELQRGELTASLRFLANKWGWSEASVRRYLSRLKTDALIDARTDAGQLVITIRNYDKYQNTSEVPDAPTDAAGDARPTQDRRSSDANDKKEIKEKKESTLFEREGPPTSRDRLFEFGVPFLVGAGLKVDRARRLLGMWRRDYGDDAVVQALEAAEREKVSDPTAFVSRILSPVRSTQNRNRTGRNRLRDSLISQIQEADRET